ncbi:MAG: aldo/keto reductase [Candidatus Hydrogenedentes bacterium]|nr:aldo/keto reductase [Candidatus Hydrogenedentota bacterium]
MMHQDILPIIGASRVEQIEENLGALSLKLSGEQMETLTKAGV